MTMIGLIGDEHQGPSCLDGDSSAKTFMNRIKSVIDPQSIPQNVEIPNSGRSHARSQQSGESPTKQHRLQDYDLPSRQRADYLLTSYWRRAVYPFLDRDEVECLYQRLWTGEDLGEDASTFLCLIHMVFSMSCIMDPETASKERVKNADVFYRRGREFISLNFLQTRSLLAVQCFLLLGEYLQSKNDPQACWMFIGLAIRIAQSLGLDLPPTSAEANSPHDREKLRRVWHSCVLMDRSLAMTLGRPAMITAQAAASVPYPSAHTDQSTCSCFSATNPPDPGETSYHFFIEALKLYEVMNEIWLALYNPASQQEPQDDAFSVYFGNLGAVSVGLVMGMDTKLWSLTHGLPTFLRYNSDVPKTILHQRQTNILWLRHRHIRLLLFRPILARFCSPHEAAHPSLEISLPRKIGLQCSVSCVETALETIDFLDRTISESELSHLDDLLPGWWYVILYIYCAAGVLVAARLHSYVLAEVSEKAVVDGWKSVMKLLKCLSSLNKYAARCAITLNLLFEKVLQQRLEIQQSPPQRQFQIHRPTTQSPQQDQIEQGQEGINSISTPSRPFAADQSPASIYDARTLQHGPAPLIESGSSQNWSFDQLYFSMSEYGTSDHSSGIDPFDPSDIRLDLDGMAWLTSLPSQLFGNASL